MPFGPGPADHRTVVLPRRGLLSLGLALPALPLAAQEAWPGRTVRIIVPFAPGGTTDIPARIIGEHLARQLGKPFVVENRSGANGNIGMEAAARSAPDGYTLGACTIGNCAIRNPHDRIARTGTSGTSGVRNGRG